MSYVIAIGNAVLYKYQGKAVPWVYALSEQRGQDVDADNTVLAQFSTERQAQGFIDQGGLLGLGIDWLRAEILPTHDVQEDDYA